MRWQFGATASRVLQKHNQQQQWRRSREQRGLAEIPNSSGESGSTRGPRCTTRGVSGLSRLRTAAFSLVTTPSLRLKLLLRSNPSSTLLTMSRSLSSTSGSRNQPSSGIFVLFWLLYCIHYLMHALWFSNIFCFIGFVIIKCRVETCLFLCILLIYEVGGLLAKLTGFLLDALWNV